MPPCRGDPDGGDVARRGGEERDPLEPRLGGDNDVDPLAAVVVDDDDDGCGWGGRIEPEDPKRTSTAIFRRRAEPTGASLMTRRPMSPLLLRSLRVLWALDRLRSASACRSAAAPPPPPLVSEERRRRPPPLDGELCLTGLADRDCLTRPLRFVGVLPLRTLRSGRGGGGPNITLRRRWRPFLPF